MTPLAISTGPENGPESSAPLLPSLNDFPILREMLGLLDREFSPEEVNDGDNGLERLFWIPPDVESSSSGLRSSSSAQSLCLLPQSLCHLPPPPPLPPPRASAPRPPK